MLFPKPKPHIRHRRHLTRLLDIPSRHIRPAEINPHVRPQRALQAANIRLIENAIAHARKQPSKIRPAEIRAGFQFGERIVGGTDGVEDDVGGGVDVEALREIRVDAEEFDAGRAGGGSGGGGLGFEGGEEGLEPFERGGIFADPDELDSAQTTGWVRSAAEVPDVFEDRGPGGDADAGADEDGDFVVEDVFGGGAVGPVDAEFGHCLAILERDFVHAHRVEAFVFFGLEGTGAEGVTDVTGEVADLADVDGDVGVEGAGGDGEGVPLVVRDSGNVDEEPLACFIAHGRFAELDLHRVYMLC